MKLDCVVYAAFGLIPFEYACRHALDSLVVQMLPKTNEERYALGRTAGEGFLIYAVSLGVALAVPGQSVKIIAATGEQNHSHVLPGAMYCCC